MRNVELPESCLICGCGIATEKRRFIPIEDGRVLVSLVREYDCGAKLTAAAIDPHYDPAVGYRVDCGCPAAMADELAKWEGS